jgi:hypothetical protein
MIIWIIPIQHYVAMLILLKGKTMVYTDLICEQQNYSDHKFLWQHDIYFIDINEYDWQIKKLLEK